MPYFVVPDGQKYIKKSKKNCRIMKIALRILKWTFLCIGGLLLLILTLLLLDRDYVSSTPALPENQVIVQPTYRSDIDSGQYRQLLAAYGQHKVLAPGFELQCLLALSHYPELKGVPIEFRVQEAFIPLSSRPAPGSVLFPWVRRKYLVIISNQSADFFEKILLHNTPFNDQVGIIGHELAHSLYYLDKSALQLARIAYCYANDPAFHDEFERATDKRAVAHGLGYQLYDYAFFVRKAFGDTQDEIAAEEGNTYLSPNELAREMGQYPFYRLPLPGPESYFGD